MTPLLRSPLALLAASCLLTACGGGSSTTPVTGTFLDSAVEGADYVAGTAAKASTNAAGQFACNTGETVAFSVGGLALGSAPCRTTITPMDLAGSVDAKSDAVVNRALALQLLDEDGDPWNGIRITAATKTALANRTLDFAATGTAFNASMSTTLASLGAGYAGRAATAEGRLLAREHFEDTLASKVGAPVIESQTQNNSLGAVQVGITRMVMQAAPSFYFPYEGSSAAVKADFPLGFLPAYGSGLAFKGKLADGSLEFYAITDRGPNGDGPNVAAIGTTGVQSAKIFPAVSFAPSIGVIKVGSNGAVLSSTMPLRFSATQKANGLALPVGAVGNSGEVPVTDSLKYEPAKADFSPFGLDIESVVVDSARNALWVSDEYGPFILKVDPSTGTILKKYQPGTGAADLPAVLAKRRANRGMEGLTLDVASGKLHGFLQSPVDDGKVGFVKPGATAATSENVRDFAKFARWIEFDPRTETSKLYAYPIDGANYSAGRTGNAKLGDLTSLGNGKFVVIEQGAAPNGKVFNWLMLVEVPSNATDIATAGTELEKNSMSPTFASPTAYANVITLKKTLLLDLNATGWLAEKAEGLALVDENTLALTNDNDFGLKTIVLDAQGKAIAGADVTACNADANGALSGCGAGVSARVARGADTERSQRLWLIKFTKKLAEFSVPAR